MQLKMLILKFIKSVMNNEDALRKELRRVNAQLRTLQLERRKLETERLQIKQILNNLKNEFSSKPDEPLLVVPTLEVKEVVQIWIDSGRTLTALAEEAAVSFRTLKSIMSGETKFTNELIADSIRTTVDVPYHQYHFVPNPYTVPKSQLYED